MHSELDIIKNVLGFIGFGLTMYYSYLLVKVIYYFDDRLIPRKRKTGFLTIVFIAFVLIFTQYMKDRDPLQLVVYAFNPETKPLVIHLGSKKQIVPAKSYKMLKGHSFLKVTKFIVKSDGFTGELHKGIWMLNISSEQDLEYQYQRYYMAVVDKEFLRLVKTRPKGIKDNILIDELAEKAEAYNDFNDHIAISGYWDRKVLGDTPVLLSNNVSDMNIKFYTDQDDLPAESLENLLHVRYYF